MNSRFACILKWFLILTLMRFFLSILISREVFHVPQNILLVPKIFSPLPVCIVHVINNDTLEEIPKVFNRVEPYIYTPNKVCLCQWDNSSSCVFFSFYLFIHFLYCMSSVSYSIGWLYICSWGADWRHACDWRKMANASNWLSGTPATAGQRNTKQ